MSNCAFRHLLREETSEDHARVDDLFSQLDLTTPDGLADFLSVSHLAYQTLDGRLQPFGTILPPPAPMEAICADLHDLGRSPPEWDCCPDLSEAHPLGLIYVIAGSHLGGTILHQRWQTSQNEIVGHAGRFLGVLSDRACWTQFVQRLPSVNVGQIERNHVVESAKACFSLFEGAFRHVVKETDYG